jgi:hypothetical protein
LKELFSRSVVVVVVAVAYVDSVVDDVVASVGDDVDKCLSTSGSW